MLHAYLVPHPPLLVPGVGGGHEIPDTRQAYEQIAAELTIQNPDTVVIISPHSILYDDYIHIAPGKKASGDFRAFGAKDIRFSVDYDTELASLIGKQAQKQNIPAGPLGAEKSELDHGVMVPLYFLKSTRIVRISLSGLPLIDHYRFGMCISKAIGMLSRRAVVIASGDMSHKLKADGPYGFAPEGPEHDAFVCDCVRNAYFRKLMTIDPVLSERAAECGLRSLAILAGTLDGMKISSQVLCYEGPFGVGYLTAAFNGDGQAPSLLPLIMEDRSAKLKEHRRGEDPYVILARQNTEQFVRTGKYITLQSDLPPEMLSGQAGVFVSIKKDGRLRGCIGTTAPTQKNIAMEILKNSAAAACHDTRFDPIEPAELNDLTYSVDVLLPAEPIPDAAALDVKRYGVIVTHGRRRGLLLPDLDGVDTVEQQIDIALRKAGINSSAPYTLERFEVVRHT